MSAGAAKLALVLFSIAAAAFVCDVLSPATPTPTASLADSVSIALIFIFAAWIFHWTASKPAQTLLLSFTGKGARRYRRRTFIRLICVLLS